MKKDYIGGGKGQRVRKGIRILGGLIGFGVPVWFVVRWQQKCIDRWKEQAEKNGAMFLLMNQWVYLKQEGRNLEDYFIRNNYNKIAIYGVGVVGQRLIKELRASKIAIAYGIDKNKDNIYSSIEVKTLEEDIPKVDAVVVTVIKEFDTIREALSVKINCPVVAIEDILDEA